MDNQNHTCSQDMSGSLLSRASQVVPVVKNLHVGARDMRDASLIPKLGRSVGSGKWQSAPVFLPGKLHGQRSLAGQSLWGCKESDMTGFVHRHTQTHTHTLPLPWFFHMVFPSLKPTALYTGCSNSAFNFNVNVSSLKRTLWPPYLTLHGTLLLPLQHSLQSNLQSSSLSVLFTPGSGQ